MRAKDFTKPVEEDLFRYRINWQKAIFLFDELERELAVFDEKIELSTLGYYEPHFDFGTSERFKAALRAFLPTANIFKLSLNV